MLHVVGFEDVVRTVYAVSFDYLPRKHPIQFTDLRKAFVRFLGQYQPNVPTAKTRIHYASNGAVEAKLAKAYSSSALDDLNQDEMIGGEHDPRSKAAILIRIKRAVEALRKLDVELAHLFDLVIHTIFSRKSARLSDGRSSAGGSSSFGIGVIWISEPLRFSTADLVELLQHELVHHLLFVDEIRFGHFDYAAIGDRRNYATSAILCTPRPLDKVVHSIVVATEIILARSAYGLDTRRITLHPPTKALRKQTLESIESVLAIDNLRALVGARVLALLEHCQSALHEPVARVVAR